MAEEEKTGFTVVDRRSSAQPSAAAPPPEDDSPAQESAAPTAQATETDATHADSSQTTDSATSDETSEPALPDPSLLLGLAAMQMETRELANTLLAVFDGHAWRALGLLADPQTGEAHVDLPAAQLAIDCVQFLLSKIEISLPDSQRREMQRRLNDLRMNYLTKAREASSGSP